MKLLDWIDIKSVKNGNLSLNPNAIHTLEQTQNSIDWLRLSANINAIDLLKKNRKNRLDYFVVQSGRHLYVGTEPP